MEWVREEPPIEPGFPLEKPFGFKVEGPRTGRVGIAIAVAKIAYQIYLYFARDETTEEIVDRMPFKVRGFLGGTFTLAESIAELAEDTLGVPSDILEYALEQTRRRKQRRGYSLLIGEEASGSVAVPDMWVRDP